MHSRLRNRRWSVLASFLLALPLFTPSTVTGQNPPANLPNRLTAEEKRDGWQLLFDGSTTKGWRGFKQKVAPRGWVVQQGTLVREAGGADLITVKQYKNFELALEWKISEGGNSGIMYRVTEDGNAPYETGPEMQVLDDARHADGKNR